MRDAPRLADRLLVHLLPPSLAETVVGDLHEQYQRGRSRLWYWRQVLETVVLSLTADLRSHKLLTLRALALGWAMLVFCKHFFMSGLVSPYVAFSGPITALLVALVGAGCGWTVGRTHRACAVPIAFAFALSVEAYVTMALGRWFYAHLTVVYWPGVVVRLSLTTILAPLSILIGGLLSRPNGVKALI